MSPKIKPRVAKMALALGGIEASMPRREIAYALSLNEDPMIRQAGAMLTDHAWRNASLSIICKNMGLGWAKIAGAIKDARKMEGEIRMANHLPQIMEDTARDALSTEETCVRCEGVGKVDSDKGKKKMCPACAGRGIIRRTGDMGARKLVFETMTLTNKSGPLIDARSVNITGSESLEDTLRALRKVRDVAKIEGNSPILDGTVEEK